MNITRKDFLKARERSASFCCVPEAQQRSPPTHCPISRKANCPMPMNFGTGWSSSLHGAPPAPAAPAIMRT